MYKITELLQFRPVRLGNKDLQATLLPALVFLMGTKSPAEICLPEKLRGFGNSRALWLSRSSNTCLEIHTQPL